LRKKENDTWEVSAGQRAGTPPGLEVREDRSGVSALNKAGTLETSDPSKSVPDVESVGCENHLEEPVPPENFEAADLDSPLNLPLKRKKCNEDSKGTRMVTSGTTPSGSVIRRSMR